MPTYLPTNEPFDARRFSASTSLVIDGVQFVLETRDQTERLGLTPSSSAPGAMIVAEDALWHVFIVRGKVWSHRMGDVQRVRVNGKEFASPGTYVTITHREWYEVGSGSDDGWGEGSAGGGSYFSDDELNAYVSGEGLEFPEDKDEDVTYPRTVETDR